VKVRIAQLSMLGGSLAFLASLYLSWVSTTAGENTGRSDFFQLLGSYSWNGLGPFGQAAALAAVALIVLVLASFLRPGLAATLPFGGCAIALAALAVVNATHLRTDAFYRAALSLDEVSVHLGTGVYVGGAAALVALLGAALMSSDEFLETGVATIAVATLLTAGLAAAYVLPTLDLDAQQRNAAEGFQFLAAGNDGAAIMLLVASFGLTFWLGGPPLRRIASAAVVLVLAVGSFSIYGTRVHWPYEAWLAIGCAAGLLVLALARSGLPRGTRLTRQHLLALEGAILLFVSLFLNWEKACYSPRAACFVANGWSGGIKGGLVAILVLLLLGSRRFSPELAVAVVIYVIGAGLAITADGSLGYGAFLGFGGAALLALAVVSGPRKPVSLDARLIPVAACLAFLAMPVATLSGSLPDSFEFVGGWRLYLAEAAAIVLALRLIRRWLSGPARDDEVLLLPVALLALTALDLGEKQDTYFIGWEGWLSLALCLLLVVLGWIGRRGGLDNFRIPEEIWRVDRISAGEN
jgi:hypothetical protein